MNSGTLSYLECLLTLDISLEKLVHAIYSVFFSSIKIETAWKNDIFNICVQNIGCGYMLEPPL